VRNSAKELRVRLDLYPSHSSGVSLEFDQEDLNDIFCANGYSHLEHAHEGPCGLTDYYRDVWYVQDTKGERHNAEAVFRKIFKSRLKSMLTGNTG